MEDPILRRLEGHPSEPPFVFRPGNLGDGPVSVFPGPGNGSCDTPDAGLQNSSSNSCQSACAGATPIALALSGNQSLLLFS